MSSPDEAAAGTLDMQAVQQRLLAAVQDFAAAHVALTSDGEDAPDPFPAGIDVPVTEVVITANAILEAASVEPFELSLWQAWGAR
jgi:hypothetical protein